MRLRGRIHGRTMESWTSFGKDIDDAIQAAMANNLPQGTPLTVENLVLKQGEAATEEELRAYIGNELKFAAKWVLATAFKMEGRFATPGGGNVAIVGQADFSWVRSGSFLSKLPVCVLTLLI